MQPTQFYIYSIYTRVGQLSGTASMGSRFLILSIYISLFLIVDTFIVDLFDATLGYLLDISHGM